VQESLRKAFAAEGFELHGQRPAPVLRQVRFGVNRESWTGQKLDITNWEDETSFVQWFVTILTVAAFAAVIFVLHHHHRASAS
jgi:putative ABC transport system permease protein